MNSSEVKSVLVDDVKAFKSFYKDSNRINVRKNCSIVFYYHKHPGLKAIIGKPCKEEDSEVPMRPFKGIFNFIGSSKANFEILRAPAELSRSPKTTLPDFLIKRECYTTYIAFDRTFD